MEDQRGELKSVVLCWARWAAEGPAEEDSTCHSCWLAKPGRLLSCSGCSCASYAPGPSLACCLPTDRGSVWLSTRRRRCNPMIPARACQVSPAARGGARAQVSVSQRWGSPCGLFRQTVLLLAPLPSRGGYRIDATRTLLALGVVNCWAMACCRVFSGEQYADSTGHREPSEQPLAAVLTGGLCRWCCWCSVPAALLDAVPQGALGRDRDLRRHAA